MRYIKHFFEDIDGIAVYPIISLLIFFGFFVLLSIYVMVMRKSHARYMAQRPLEIEDVNSSEAAQS